MMKVKPFSYHIPPRRKATSTPVNTGNSLSCSSNVIERSNNRSCNSGSGTRSSNKDKKGNNRSAEGINNNRNYGSTAPTSSLLPSFTYIESVISLCGGGTVLILLLFGFIGVAGQGTLHDVNDDGNSHFAKQTHHNLPPNHFSYRNFFQLPIYSNFDAYDDSNSDDETLQQQISSMGHYGAKYKNNSMYPNYHSHHPPPHYYFHRSRKQYKMGQEGPNFGTYLPPSSYDSLSLSLLGKGEDNEGSNEDDRQKLPISASRNNSGEIESGIREERRNENKDKEEKASMADDETLTNRLSNTSTRSSIENRFVTDKATAKLRFKSSLNRSEYDAGGSRDMDKEDDDASLNPIEVISIPEEIDGETGEEKRAESDKNKDYEEDTLEKFIPGNRSHTSGKLRFRQSSQAELDGVVVDLTENSLTSTSTSSDSSSRRRPRRSVVHLYDMVVCSTGCNPLIFKGYGCYCGFLGSGLTVDGIDKCCAKHDWCYHHAKCPPLLTYFVPYYWTCNHGRPQCVTDFRGWKGICGAHLCECDRQFAECLKKFPCPRSRAMCVTSPWSNSHSEWHADSRAFPFTVSNRRPRFPQWQSPPIPPPPRIPYLPFPPPSHSQMGRIFS